MKSHCQESSNCFAKGFTIFIFVMVIADQFFPCASNTQGREEGEVEVKDGPGHQVSGQIGESLTDLLVYMFLLRLSTC